MTDFKENINDIINAWGGYPLHRPVCEDNETSDDPFPAYNSGHVQLKCFINNVCPFYKTPYKEDSIIFNTETYEEIKDLIPNRITTALMTTPGVEGLHFEPRKVFRHNYMNVWNPDRDSPSFNPIADTDEIFDNFSLYYKSISPNKEPIDGVDKTLYRAEYDWAVVDSVFDKPTCSGGTSSLEGCSIEAQWAYRNQSVHINRMEDDDIRHDYPPDYYDEYKDSITIEDGKPIPKPGIDPKIQRFSIQMPEQIKTHDENSNGVHWKVVKRMPIFKGADFFIRFYKTANEPVKNIFSEDAPVSFNDVYYKPLDYTNDDKVLIDPVDNFTKYANEAVRSSEKSGKSNIYAFYSQAYYIIEMGGDVSENKYVEYYIIIPARGNPIFVHMFLGDDADDVVAKRLGDPFRGISGEQLIDADYFDIIVRNHLGRLVIQFEGKGFNDIPPWIVERRDWVPKKVTEGETAYMVEEPKALIVPRCQLKIWGGNIKCGFLFGYLQYEEKVVSFIYPPRDVDDALIADETFDKAFTEFEPKFVKESISYFDGNPLWLPMNRIDGDDDQEEKDKAVHKILFEAYNLDGVRLEQGSIGDSTVDEGLPADMPLFTQDAQYYKNYDDDTTTDWEKGFFYYDRPIKEFSPPMPGKEQPKTSNIIIKKYTFMNYERTKHQGFDTYIGMMCGDHYFTGSFDLSLAPMADQSDFIGEFSSSGIGTDGWFLLHCKTPILTSFRLISEPSLDPRWDDGTTIKEGINKNPDGGIPDGSEFTSDSEFFLDASDHVMNFSHSWTSSGLTSLEHSGTIQFYLNKNMIVEDLSGATPINNVTDKLLALQDKTFYIEIWAGYREILGTSSSEEGEESEESSCEHSNYTRIPGFYKMFTGLCPGGSLSSEYNKEIMTCRLNDYSVVLKNMLFFNSPWFDAMKDSVAIREILRMAGFRDQGTYDPAKIINDIADDAVSEDPHKLFNHFDGRAFKNVNFGLPSGYNRLEQPALKFNDGDPLIDAIDKISSYSAKIFYFDEWGMAHYEDFQDIVEEDFQKEVPLTVLYFFTTNPEKNQGQLVFNKVERSFDVDSVVTHLKTLTNTPDMHMLIRDRIKWETMENPETSGFIGYQKTFFQAESMFGSKEAQISAMNKYAVMFKPIITVKFETYGLPMRATDIISIDDEVVRVIKVDHSFSAEKNQWWMTVDCQRFQAISPTDLISDEG